MALVRVRGPGSAAAAAGWLHRAHHHLDDEPPCPEQCFPAWTDAEQATARGDRAAALAATHRMTRLALRSGSPDLLALSRQAEASVLLAHGRRAESLALLDEAMRAVTAGGLTGLFTGLLYDLALTRCTEAAELGRAVEWTNAAMEWCTPRGRAARRTRARAPPLRREPFRGVCRAHRVQVLDLLGAWALAEAEARQACREIPVDRLDAAAAAYCAAGDVQRRQGRLEEAAVSYAHAHELGRVPNPGSRCCASPGAGPRPRSRASTSRSPARATPPRPPGPGPAPRRPHGRGPRRPRRAGRGSRGGLPGGPGRGRTSPPGDGIFGAGRGRPRRGPAGAAVRLLRPALAGWLALRVPYEAARTRTLLAAAFRALGDGSAARRERDAARAVFERLGAVPV
ncbi:hypothetical protein O1L60_12225 [Streptomyces diastatochromogenes]|nr:hypothetical protein [Streptomyces diastatochromogenes]